MKKSKLPPPFQKVEGRALRGPVPPSFEAFYRAHVRFCAGERVRTVDLRSRYLAWAEDRGEPSLPYRALRRAMENVGHRYFTSDGSWYGDAGFADAVPGAPEDFPLPPVIAADDALALVRRADRLAAELGAFRAVVAQLSGQLSGRVSADRRGA